MNYSKIVESLEMSTSAYRDTQPYSPRACSPVLGSPDSGIQYFLRVHKDTLWVTFRGSDSLRDWGTNLVFWKKTIPYNNTKTNIRIHKGFLEAYQTVRDKILCSVTEDIHYVKVSGHSQGAALSVLCAVDIQYNFPDRDIEAVLFGCPRIGNKAFMLSYNKRVNKTVRVENANDIVTKLPFAFMGYRHVGAKLHIGLARFPFWFSANDHYPVKYYSALLAFD